MRLVYSAYWAMASGGGVSYWWRGFEVTKGLTTDLSVDHVSLVKA